MINKYVYGCRRNVISHGIRRSPVVAPDITIAEGTEEEVRLATGPEHDQTHIFIVTGKLLYWIVCLVSDPVHPFPFHRAAWTSCATC